MKAVKTLGPVSLSFEVSGCSSMVRIYIELEKPKITRRKIKTKERVSIITWKIKFIRTAKVSKMRNYRRKMK